VNSSFERPVKSEVAYDILSYLLKHPGAEGPIEAIAEWWLLEERIEVGMNQISKAIDELVRGGFLLERRSRVDVFYRINPERNKEIEELLKTKG